jgi:ectoine hydroxylase
MNQHQFSSEQTQQFDRDGFVVVKQLFDGEEIQLLESAGRANRENKKAWAAKDAAGGESKLWLATERKRDIYNAYVHNPRIVRPMEQLLGGSVYLWHYKMMLKEPRVGGAWEWHQDYGYWYGDKCLYPRLASCMIGVNKATRENGCLQVLRGSHRLGRVEHGTTGQQAGADLERVEAASKRLELVYCELNAGDALFFHCNLLHRSDQNRSEHPRWAFICCYNSMENIPYLGKGHGEPVPITPWDDGDIKRLGNEQLANA